MKRKWKSTICPILESAVITALIIGAFFVGRTTYQPEVICVDPGRISGINWTLTEFSFFRVTFIQDNGTEIDYQDYFLEGEYDYDHLRYSFTFYNSKTKINDSIDELSLSIEVINRDTCFITIYDELGIITWIVFCDYVSVGHTPETFITEFHIDGIFFWQVK